MSIARLRKEGADSWRGFPTTKHEEWKYTPLGEVERRAFRPVERPGASCEVPVVAGLEAAPRIVFVDGFYSEPLSRLPPGAAASPRYGETAPAAANPLVAFNAANAQEGARVRIEGEIAEPLRLVFLATAAAEGRSIHPRNWIEVAPGGKAVVIEEWYGAGSFLSNPVTEILVAENASLSHIKIQDQSRDSFHIASVQARTGRDAKFVQFSFSFGARLARNDIGVCVAGANGEAHLNGLYLGRGSQLIDHHTVVDHAVAHCHSDELYKGILDDTSRGVFNGKIFVRKDAQKTDAIQSNKALLLSKTARVDTKPQLEIFADDVRCTHGATIGQLDEAARFYLRARGIPDAAARRMLIQAFARDVVDRVENEALRAHLVARAEGILSERT